MALKQRVQSEHASSIRHWEQTAPWYRRISMRMGIETKLVLCFVSVLSGVLGITCFSFAWETHHRLADIMAEQARQMAMALSLTSERMLRVGDWDELNMRGKELIKNRNILYVGYMDANAQSRVVASQDPDFHPGSLKFDFRSLMQARARHSPMFGDYLEVVAPVLSWENPASERREEQPASRHLLGYVAVGVSQAREEAQMLRVNYLIAGVTCLMLCCAIPLAVLLVHRVFSPIRTLDAVMRRITRGDLDARVEIHRPDVIGDVARSFDEMVGRVRQHQAELVQANRDLEKKVEQRTAQLESANTRLRTEITEKEDFLRTVSHDLNAPLRNIGGMVQMLLLKHQGALDEDIIHRLERIKSNVEIETSLIGELLELSRIKTRRQRMEPVEVSGIIQELRDLFESDLREKRIELITENPLPVLEAERLRIRQVFQNLIDNAIKYMGDSPVRQIHIGSRLEAGEAVFYVRDTGIGIDPEDIEKVFYVFRRGRNSLAQKVSGKGVGLASVKSIIEMYDGRIWVTSEPGKGCTFQFTINGKYVPHCQHAEPVATSEESA